jgi:hypothetical protein
MPAQRRDRPTVNFTLPPATLDQLDVLGRAWDLSIDRGKFHGQPNRSAVVERLAKQAIEDLGGPQKKTNKKSGSSVDNGPV